MKKILFLQAAISLVFCCMINFSCKKTDDSTNSNLLGTDPLGPDRPVPYHNPDWMGLIDDSKYLPEITIPGTHDCGADLHTSEQGTESYVTIAQDFTIANQLEMGVRWFDVRLSAYGSVFHWKYYLHKNFNDLISQARTFLSNHPTEVVIFAIKQENTSSNDDTFANGIYSDYVYNNLDLFWMNNWNNNVIPQIGQVRGKIVLVRQFGGSEKDAHLMGIRIQWADNTPGEYASTDNPVYAYVQDNYKIWSYNDYTTKLERIEACINKAHTEPCPQRCFYINYTSGEWPAFTYSLKTVAAFINPLVEDTLFSSNFHNCGVIMVNFAGGSDDGQVPPGLVQTIINCNDFAPAPITTVQIGTQVWMAENLRVTNYRNGDKIFHETDATAWTNLSTGAYCYYDNDYGHVPTDGYLYNANAVNDPRGLAPAGFHIPTQAEWQTLINFLGGASAAGGKLKENGAVHWSLPNTGASNSSGFTACGAGDRQSDNGEYCGCGQWTYFWTATACPGKVNYNYSYTLNYNDASISQESTPGASGISVRCIKD